MQRVINFSAGETSGMLTIENYHPGDIVLFLDTTREHEKAYKFLNDFEANEGIPITRLQYPGGFEGFLKRWGNGSYGKKIPNRLMRECTIELKVKTARRYMRSLGIMSYENMIGFRYDEHHRVSRHKERWQKVKTTFPLYEKKITKEMVKEYWSKKPYRLEIPSILGNCTLCFMKGKDSIIKILSQYPELADPWIRDEEAAKRYFGHTYMKGVSISELLEIAKQKPFKLDNAIPAYSCACAA